MPEGKPPDDQGKERDFVKRWIILLLLLCLLPEGNAGAEEWNISVSVPDEIVHPWETVLIRYTLPEAGEADLVLMDEDAEERFIVAKGVKSIAGQNSLHWNGTYLHETAPEGTWRLVLTAEGLRAETRITVGSIRITEPEETEEPAPEAEAERGTGDAGEEEAETVPEVFTPSHTSPLKGMDTSLNYWTMPMDIADEETIWQVLTSPITVADNGKGEKAQIILRSEPSSDSRGVGSITCATQGLHVLERGEEWSLVECYSSSFHDSAVLNWNALVQGYVPTRYLQEITPNQEIGMVIDKLTQRLYIFREGHLFSTLLVSTGLANKRQPYNETRSGEFLLTSKVGTFSSDNLKCGSAIRFNKGDLLHEVPYTVMSDGSPNYKTCEVKLGTKASHGCIRVQRKKTPEGVNMSWIWNNLKKNSQTRLLIWEDWQGRQIGIPSDDTVLYRDAEQGKTYHSSEFCYSLREGETLIPFRYGELEDEPCDGLTRCDYCTPPLRKAEIEEINRIYAPGGDHDPVMTEALKKCPRIQRK